MRGLEGLVVLNSTETPQFAGNKWVWINGHDASKIGPSKFLYVAIPPWCLCLDFPGTSTLKNSRGKRATSARHACRTTPAAADSRSHDID